MSTQELDAQEVTKTFDINMKSEVDEQIYSGRFTTSKLDIGKTIQMGVLKAQYIGGLANIDVGYQLIAEAVALCEVALIQRPRWFQEPMKLRALDVLGAIAKEVRSFEGSFRAINAFLNASRDTGSDTGDGGLGGQSQGGGSVEPPEVDTSHPPQVVDKQVPTISKVG